MTCCYLLEVVRRGKPAVLYSLCSLRSGFVFGSSFYRNLAAGQSVEELNINNCVCAQGNEGSTVDIYLTQPPCDTDK